MNKLALPPCPSSHSDLTRHTTGLTEAHREFIRLLAKIAVDAYLAEHETLTKEAVR